MKHRRKVKNGCQSWIPEGCDALSIGIECSECPLGWTCCGTDHEAELRASPEGKNRGTR
jgi:hypothetical protein